MLRHARLSLLAASLVLVQLTACVAAPVAPSQAAQATTAASAANAPADSSTSRNAAGEEVQCKTVYSTGSRLDKKKVCTTAAERERIAAAAKEFVDHSSRSSQILSGP